MRHMADRCAKKACRWFREARHKRLLRLDTPYVGTAAPVFFGGVLGARLQNPCIPFDAVNDIS